MRKSPPFKFVVAAEIVAQMANIPLRQIYIMRAWALISLRRIAGDSSTAIEREFLARVKPTGITIATIDDWFNVVNEILYRLTINYSLKPLTAIEVRATLMFMHEQGEHMKKPDDVVYDPSAAKRFLKTYKSALGLSNEQSAAWRSEVTYTASTCKKILETPLNEHARHCLVDLVHTAAAAMTVKEAQVIAALRKNYDVNPMGNAQCEARLRRTGLILDDKRYAIHADEIAWRMWRVHTGVELEPSATLNQYFAAPTQAEIAGMLDVLMQFDVLPQTAGAAFVVANAAGTFTGNYITAEPVRSMVLKLWEMYTK